ncbi:uncharacterized protein LOC120331591 [Styela clava]|uniref:uncharacterized protein LOC120331591 n=1 Tax=Styela clava TaxID=7725 RepID=UPI00193ACB93|nr:uncharacterized protein LOC120331591 [Styela clava]
MGPARQSKSLFILKVVAIWLTSLYNECQGESITSANESDNTTTGDVTTSQLEGSGMQDYSTTVKVIPEGPNYGGIIIGTLFAIAGIIIIIAFIYMLSRKTRLQREEIPSFNNPITFDDDSTL